MVRESNTATVAGTYYLPQLSKEVRVLSSFKSKTEMAIRGYRNLSCYAQERSLVAQELISKVHLENDTVDFIFTDPPYVGKVQYGELNFIWESWLGYKGDWLKGEVTVNPYRNKSIEDWDFAMREALVRCFIALKPGRWLSLCYHDTEPETWARVQNIILDIGFEIHSVNVLDPKQKSQNQLNAEKVVKGDLVLNCRKLPDRRTDPAQKFDSANISKRVKDILIETMSNIGGQTRDGLWNIVVKRLLTRGQMAEHRFDDILSEVAVKSESGRWFLREEYEILSENDLKNEEEAGRALERFSWLRCIGVPVVIAAELAFRTGVYREMDEDAIEKNIRKSGMKGIDTSRFRLGGRMKGCEFYDCLFFYLTRYLKGRATGKTPRRNLAEFLEEYLVRFREKDRWLYRPPTDAEAESLRKSRQSGLGRRIRQYVAYLKGEGDFPKERMPDVKTLVAWLKHCANFGLAEAGVALYEKGGLMGQLSRLSEDDRYDAEDYYAQCRRNLPRSTGLEDLEDTDMEDEGEVEES